MRVIAAIDMSSEHPTFTPSIAPASNDEKENERRSHGTVENLASKSSFSMTVASTVNALMSNRGYSRQRATSFLLQCIRGVNDPPSDSKIINFMKDHGVGFEDAKRILTVSDAINISRKEHTITPTQAVDDLTSRLNDLRYLTQSPTPPVPQASPDAKAKEASENYSTVIPNTKCPVKPLPRKETKKESHRPVSSSRRKSIRKLSNHNNIIPSKHLKTRSSKKNSSKQNSILVSPSYQSPFKTKTKQQSNEISSVSDCNNIVKNNVPPIMRNLSTPNNSSKRKRDRSQCPDVGIEEGPPCTRLRRTSSNP